MSYIQRDSSPFATCTISNSNAIAASGVYYLTTVFDTPDKSWATFNSATKKIDTGVDTFGVGIYSPNSNIYGILTYETPSAGDMVLRGQNLPISSGAGGSVSRGDDQSFFVDSSQLYQYRLISAGVSQAPDLTRSILILMTIGV